MKNVNRRERFPKNGGKNQMIFGGYFKNMPLSLEIQNSDCVQRGSSLLSTVNGLKVTPPRSVKTALSKKETPKIQSAYLVSCCSFQFLCA